MEDRRNVGENSCNSGDGTDQTGPILDLYDDDDDDDLDLRTWTRQPLCTSEPVNYVLTLF